MRVVSTAAVNASCDSMRSPCVVAVTMNSVPPVAPPTVHAIARRPGVSIVRVSWPPSTTWMNLKQATRRRTLTSVDATRAELVLQELERRFLRVAPWGLGGVVVGLSQHVLLVVVALRR